MAGGVTFRLDFDDGVGVGVGWRVDFYDSDATTATITSITKANPGVVTTSAAHGYSNGDKVFIFGSDMTEVNFTVQTVANKTATTFEIEDTSGHTSAGTTGTTNTITEIEGGANPLIFSWAGQDSDKYGLDSIEGVIKKSIAHVTVDQKTAGQFDSIISAEDDQYIIYIYKDEDGTHSASTFSQTDNLYWVGNLIPENISEPYNMVVPYDITFVAKDGLERLKDIDFDSSGTLIDGRQSVLTTIRFCLNQLSNLDNPGGTKIGFYESVDIYESNMTDELNIGPLEQADIDPEHLRDRSISIDNPLSCEEVLYTLCTNFQFRVYLSKGKWNLERVNQLDGGTIERREYDTLGDLVDVENAYDPVITTGANTRLMTQRQVKRSWKSAKIKFNAGQQINMIPYGEFESNAFASDTAFVSGGWTISGSATIKKTEVNEPGSEYAVAITSFTAGASAEDYIQSPAIKATQGNYYNIKLKVRANTEETSDAGSEPIYWWLITWQQSGGTLYYLHDNASATAITGITQANPGVVTAGGHGLSNGDIVMLGGVNGMTEVNNNTYTVANQTANTFELQGTDTTAFTPYTSGGTVSRYYWNTNSAPEAEGLKLLRAWQDQNIGTFFVPLSGDAGDMYLRLYEAFQNDYTFIQGSGLLYDRVIGTVGPGNSLPIEVTEITGEITASGSNFKHKGFDIKYGDVGGFANQDYVLPIVSELVLDVGTTVPGDTIQFDINGVAKTFTTATSRTPSAVSKANPAVVNDTAHPYSNGNVIVFWNAVGMTELNGKGQLGKTYTVAGATANTYQLSGVDSTSYGTFTSGETILLSSDTFSDGYSLRWMIKNYATAGYKVGWKDQGAGVERVTVSGLPTPDSNEDMGTVTIVTTNGSNLSKISQQDAVEAEATVTSRPLSKGAISVNGNVSTAWYEKGDSTTDTDSGGTNITLQKLLLLGIMRNYGATSKRHTGLVHDGIGSMHFGSVIHDSTNDNGVYLAWSGVSYDAIGLDWNGQLMQHQNASITLTYTTSERTVGEELNNSFQASPFTQVSSNNVTEIISDIQSSGAANVIQLADGSGGFTSNASFTFDGSTLDVPGNIDLASGKGINIVNTTNPQNDINIIANRNARPTGSDQSYIYTSQFASRFGTLTLQGRRNADNGGIAFIVDDGTTQREAMYIDPDALITVLNLDVDNININGNTISSTDTNGDINLSPNGTGTVVINTDLDVDNINVNGNTISSTSGDININPIAGSQVIIDGFWTFDGREMYADGTTTEMRIKGSSSSTNQIFFDSGDMVHVFSDWVATGGNEIRWGTSVDAVQYYDGTANELTLAGGSATPSMAIEFDNIYMRDQAKSAGDVFKFDPADREITLAADTDIIGPSGSAVIRIDADKIGFFNNAPIAQPGTATYGPALFVANTSGIADDSATWAGYQVGDIVLILKNYGLIA